MKRKLKFLCLVLALSLLSGCHSSQYMASQEENDQIVEVAAITGYGVNSEGSLDDDGLYFPYTGGEMTLDLFLQASGYRESGVTMLLFLDGQPQPYRLGEGNSAYMHTLYPKNTADSSFPISFTPITGEAGDTLELCVLYLPAYGCRGDDGKIPWYENDNALFYMTRIRLEETPENCEIPKIKDRFIYWDSAWDYESTSGWPEGQVSWSLCMSANGYRSYGEAGTEEYRVEALDAVTLELMGDPEEERILVVYVDGEPVLVDGKAPTVSPVEGRKMIYYMRIDHSDCETMVFALVLRKNYHGDGTGWTYYPEYTDFRVLHMVNVA